MKDYECSSQMSLFDYTMPQFEIKNKIRLIELFAGYGSQAMALDEIGADYEHYKVVEFDKYAVMSYNAVHGTNFQPTDIREVPGICKIESIYRIRKLTPRECGRLMAVSDRNINHILSVVSNSQAYKQFGNSIVVKCMVEMFSNLNIQGLPRWEARC